ncbi:Mlo1p PWA37_000707 [Arxiozyma heterogenica]|uniref:Mlo1p n=1 Tax=Arxiozyma heterogenica TaxID=278026 RepID=UPI002F0B5602
MNTVKYIVFCIKRLLIDTKLYKNRHRNKLPIRYSQFIVEKYEYKRWYELKGSEKEDFIQNFVKNYQKHYPKSKTNLSLKELSIDKKTFHDSPCVFGVFYDDIWKCRQYGSSNNNTRFQHPNFINLLIKR